MITDDARVVDAQACQVESWVRRNRASTEYWALSACNFTGNLELTFGGARTNEAGGTHTSDVVLQGKTVFKTLEPDGWSWGLAAGYVHKPSVQAGSPVMNDVYAYLPASFSFKDGRVVLHANLGWTDEKENAQRRDFLTWGVGAEIQLGERTWLIAESFGRNEGRPLLQVGIRHWIVPGQVQVDATYGNRFGLPYEERWLSVGLRFLSARFLP